MYTTHTSFNLVCIHLHMYVRMRSSLHGSRRRGALICIHTHTERERELLMMQWMLRRLSDVSRPNQLKDVW